MAANFDDFWILYPRKVAKAHALVMWKRLTDSEKFAAIQSLPVHIRYWEAAGRSGEKIPHAGTWLNPVEGRRWEDELEMPKQKEVSDAWWTSNEGIQRKAREMEITARGGESYQDLKARILAKTRAA